MMAFSLFIVVPLAISDRGDKISFIFIRIWAKLWAILSGIRFEIYGSEHIQRNTPYIFIFNHRSFIDAPIFPIAIPKELRALGKEEISRIPIFSWVVGRLAVWVDRSSVESRKSSLEKLMKIVKQGNSVVVAPEGTRNDSKETLLPFQKGAFRLSVETKIPILPMAVIGAEKIMKRGSLLLTPGKIKIYFSEPITPPTPSDTAVNDLAEKCRNRLEAMLLAHE
jgi:1-acyl-sn-glycerol-3-phosphate acyltransferase